MSMSKLLISSEFQINVTKAVKPRYMIETGKFRSSLKRRRLYLDLNDERPTAEERWEDCSGQRKQPAFPSSSGLLKLGWGGFSNGNS